VATAASYQNAKATRASKNTKGQVEVVLI
jgi:hypothetical protein